MAKASTFGKNIALNSGFDVGTRELLDSRAIAADLDELNELSDTLRADGLVVWVVSEKALYVWDRPNGEWVKVSGEANLGDYEVFEDAFNTAYDEVNGKEDSNGTSDDN